MAYTPFEEYDTTGYESNVSDILTDAITPTTPAIVEDTTTATDTKSDKLSLLERRRQEKLQVIGNISGNDFYDADSPFSRNTGIDTDQITLRMSNPENSTAFYVDAPEAPSTIEGKQKRPATPEEIAKYNASMVVKDNYMMGTTPASKEEIQDLVDNPLTPENQKLYDDAMRQAYDQGLGTGTLTGTEGNLDKYDRQKAQVYTDDAVEGYETESLQDRLLDTGIGTIRSYKKPVLADYNSLLLGDKKEVGKKVELVGKSRLSESIDLAQSQGLKFYADLADAAIDTSRAMLKGLNVDQETIDEFLPENARLLGTNFNIQDVRDDEELRDRLTGFRSRDAWNQEQKKYSALVGDGEYASAAWNVVTNLDRYLAQSAPEMGALMVPYAGIPLVVATRLNNQAEEFEEENGRKMTGQEMVETGATIIGTLVPEKLLIKSGANKVLDGFTGKKGSKKDVAVGVGVSGTGEALQEGAEAVQEQWATGKAEDRYDLDKLKEYATSDDTIGGIIAGGTMGTALRGGGETAAAVGRGLGNTVTSGKERLASAEEVAAPQEEVVKSDADKAAEKYLYESPKAATVDVYPEAANEMEAQIKANVEKMPMEQASTIYTEGTRRLEELEGVAELTEDQQSEVTELKSGLKFVKAKLDNVKKNMAANLTKSQVEELRNMAPIDSQYDEKIEPMKNIAREVVKQGNLEVLGSDLDVKTRADRVTELVELLAMDEDLDQATLDNLAAKLGGTVADRQTVTRANENGKALKVLKKSQSQVGQEATTGPRGFISYFNNIKTARDNKDEKAELSNMNKMAGFIDSHSNKLSRMKSAEEQFIQEEYAKAELTAKNRGITVTQALREAEEGYRKNNSQVEVNYSDKQKPIRMGKHTMLEKDRVGGNFNMGVYQMMNGIEQELQAMTDLYANVNGDQVAVEEQVVNQESAANQEQTTAAPEVITFDLVKDYVDNNITAENADSMLASIDGDTTLDEELRAKVAKYINGRKDEFAAAPTTEAKPQEMDIDPDMFAAMNEEAVVANEQTAPASESNVQEDMPVEMDADAEMLAAMNEDMPVTEINVAEEAVTEISDADAEMLAAMNEEAPASNAEMAEAMKTTEAKIEELEVNKVESTEQLRKGYQVLRELEARLEVAVVNNDDTTSLEERIDLVKEKLNGENTYMQKWIDSNVSKKFKAWRGAGSSTTTLGSMFKVNRATGLNFKEVKAPEKLVNDLTSVLKTTQGKVAADANAQDIGRWLLFDENSNVNDATVLAIDKALTAYIDENGKSLGFMPEMDDMLTMLPFMKSKVYSKDMVTALEAESQLMEFFSDGGGLLKFEAEKIGAAIMKDLGVSGIKDATPEVVLQEMKASLGGMAIALGIKKKYFKPITGFKDGKKEAIPFLKATNVIKKDSVLKQFRNRTEAMADMFDVDAESKNTYSLTPNKKQFEVPIKNMPYSKANKTQKNFKNDLAEMEWKPNSGVDTLIEMYGQDPEGLKALLGKKTGPVLTAMNFDDRTAQESKNVEVDTQVDELFTMLDKTRTKEGYASVWFDYFVAKNGRTNMKSITVNPQTDKRLSRFLVTVIDSNTEVTTKEIIDVSSKKGIGFMYGIVQGFEQSGLPEIDSDSQASIIKAGKELLSKSDEELKGMIAASAHPGHAMLAYANIKKMREAKDGKFESDLVLETDGLTNGISFKFLQFPTQKVMELLEKVGILTPRSKFYNAKTMAEVKGNKKTNGFLDMYESIGNNFVIPDLDKEDAQVLELANDALLDMNDKKAVRQLAKDPVMVTGYSAGEESTKKNIVKLRLKDFATAVTEGRVSDENLAKLFPGVDVKGLLKDNSMFSKQLSPVRKRMTKFFANYYAEPMYEAMSAELGELKEIGDNVTAAYNFMYEVMNLEYVDRLAKKLKENQGKPGRKGINGLLTEEERIDVIKGMIKDKIGPFVMTSETRSEEDMLVVLSRSLRDIEEDIKAVSEANSGIKLNKDDLKVKLQISDSELTKMGKDAETIGIQLVMRGVGTPGAAGGVLQTHTEDNHTLARIFGKRKDKFSHIFDAQVLGIDQLDAVQGYNKEFFELNREHSMLDAVRNALESTLNSKAGKRVDAELKKKQQKDKKAKSGEDMFRQLTTDKEGVDALREEIFSDKVRIGQMVGPDGLMYEADPKKELDTLMKRKKKVASMISSMSKKTKENGLSAVGSKINSIMKTNGCM